MFKVGVGERWLLFSRRLRVQPCHSSFLLGHFSHIAQSGMVIDESAMQRQAPPRNESTRLNPELLRNTRQRKPAIAERIKLLGISITSIVIHILYHKTVMESIGGGVGRVQ